MVAVKDGGRFHNFTRSKFEALESSRLLGFSFDEKSLWGSETIFKILSTQRTFPI